MNGVGIYNLPETSFAKIKNDIELYKESVVRLLNTMPGERPYDPLFGCPLRKLLFEPDLYYVSRSEILNITTEIKEDSHFIKIYLHLRVKKTSQTFNVDSDIELAKAA